VLLGSDFFVSFGYFERPVGAWGKGGRTLLEAVTTAAQVRTVARGIE
jgi:hypothetical protein